MSKPVQNAASDRSGELSRFDELAGRRLYRRNIFAVTGLAVPTQGASVRRQRQKVQARLAVADGWPGDPASPLVGEYGREEVRAAFEGFNDPRRRLTDELFWRWGAAADSGCGCPDTLHQRHDEAVRQHATALEAQDGRLDLPAPEQQALWKSAAQAWDDVLAHDRLRDHIAHRIRTLDDPRLDEHLADAFVARIPALLVSPFAEYAARTEVDGAAVAAQAASWTTSARFAGPLADIFDEVLATTHRDISRKLRTAETKRNARQFDEAVAILREQVTPAFERLAAFRSFLSGWRYDETALIVAVGLNNLALAIKDEYQVKTPSAAQRTTMLELVAKAHDIAPAAHEAQFKQNWAALQMRFAGGGLKYAGAGRAPKSSRPGRGKKVGVVLGLAVTVLTILWFTAGPAVAIGVAVAALYMIGSL